MNKKEVDCLIPKAYKVLSDVKIADMDGKIEKGFRSQISSFGASVSMGSLLSAVAFFSEDGRSAVKRSKLMDAIYRLLCEDEKITCNEKKLYNYLTINGVANNSEIKEKIINIAIALKLAMNLYELKEDNQSTKGN